MICIYHQNEEELYITNKLSLWINPDENELLLQDSVNKIHSIDINYCPMCGKELINGKKEI